jgi:hypothetical protein
MSYEIGGCWGADLYGFYKASREGYAPSWALTGPRPLISLFEMLAKFADYFVTGFFHLQEVRLGMVANHENDFQLTEKDRDRLNQTLKYLSVLGPVADMEGTKHLADDLIQSLNYLGPDEIDAKIDSLQITVQRELEDKKFFYVPSDRSHYYDNKSICGPLVAEKFPGSVTDIIEAGNCYALERPTACVFHLMRVIPYGMTALAKMLKVKYKKPVICLDWNGIIQPIEAAVERLRQTSRTPKKLDDVQYYSEIVQHLYFCKDAWRNHVSHSREPYDMAQAKSVLDHVQLIMQLVGKRQKRPFRLR